MRRDHEPCAPHVSCSGLPIPSNGSRRQAARSTLIRLRIRRSAGTSYSFTNVSAFVYVMPQFPVHLLTLGSGQQSLSPRLLCCSPKTLRGYTPTTLKESSSNGPGSKSLVKGLSRAAQQPP